MHKVIRQRKNIVAIREEMKRNPEKARYVYKDIE